MSTITNEQQFETTEELECPVVIQPVLRYVREDGSITSYREQDHATGNRLYDAPPPRDRASTLQRLGLGNWLFGVNNSNRASLSPSESNNPASGVVGARRKRAESDVFRLPNFARTSGSSRTSEGKGGGNKRGSVHQTWDL
jgi:hypothetical protein